jgi:short subunit dehydrogenase-like uncharacterized protein
MKPSSKFHIVVYGASGFTGQLVAEYLASRYRRARRHGRFIREEMGAVVIASEAKQSRHAHRLDCFVARAPRNDDGHRRSVHGIPAIISRNRA